MDSDRSSSRRSGNDRDRSRERASTKDKICELNSGKDRHRDRDRNDGHRNRRRGSVDRELEREIRDDGDRHSRRHRSRGDDSPLDRYKSGEHSPSPALGSVDHDKEEPLELRETSRKRSERREESLEEGLKSHAHHHRYRGDDSPRRHDKSGDHSPSLARGSMDHDKEQSMERRETSRKPREEPLDEGRKSYARHHRSRGDDLLGDLEKSRERSLDRDQQSLRKRKRRDHREESPEETRKRHSRHHLSPVDDSHRRDRDKSGDRSSSPFHGQGELMKSRQTSRRVQCEESPKESRKRLRVIDKIPRDEKEIVRFEDSVDEVNGTYHEKKRDKVKVKEDERKRDEVKVKEEEREMDEVIVKEYDGKENKTKRKERRFSDALEVVEKRSMHMGGEQYLLKDNKVKENVKFENDPLANDVIMNGEEYLLKDKIKESVKLENGPAANAVAAAASNVDSIVPVTSVVSHTHLPAKVSLITTTNQNEGVNITRSDEVTGKFSTDGIATSGAGKSGNLSFDALAKAKKTLQMQKELSEKLKKIPVLNKLSGASSGSNSVSTTSGSAVLSSQALLEEMRTLQKTSTSASLGVPSLSASNYEAVKRAQELASKMGFRQDPEFGPFLNMFSSGPPTAVTAAPKSAKVPVLLIDAQGREVDEHGNVINMMNPANLSTLKVNINKQKKEAFQIFRPDLDINSELNNPHFDERMGIDKTKLLRPKKMSFQFVEEGRWSKQAEIMKFKNLYGEAQARELRMKQSQYDKLMGDDINPNMVQVLERVKREEDKIPDIEWWDIPLMTSGRYSDFLEGMDKLNMEKITILIEHPRPIDPPAEPAAPPPQALKLTKKEQKKLRTQRRLAKERDRQEMIRQGLIEPPKPKVKMSNLMKVLGSEATQDPTRHEMEIRNAAAEREQAHVDRNIARKLTPAEKREKKERKLFEDTLETLVSVFKINSLAHKQLQYKVDVNAQENRLTGCAVIEGSFCVVVVEGCQKSIKRYGKLMLRRIDWSAPVEDDAGEDTITPNNCVLVWQGSIAKPSFNRFLVKKCNSQTEARKVFLDAGVPHYYDMSANFSDELL